LLIWEHGLLLTHASHAHARIEGAHLLVWHLLHTSHRILLLIEHHAWLSHAWLSHAYWIGLEGSVHLWYLWLETATHCIILAHHAYSLALGLTLIALHHTK